MSTGTIISKNRESLVSLNRMIIYFSQIDNARYMNKKDSRLRIKHISREISSLGEYANFLSSHDINSDKNKFLKSIKIR